MPMYGGIYILSMLFAISVEVHTESIIATIGDQNLSRTSNNFPIEGRQDQVKERTNTITYVVIGLCVGIIFVILFVLIIMVAVVKRRKAKKSQKWIRQLERPKN